MPALTATYTSPTNEPSPHTISEPLLDTSSTPSSKDRVACLGHLQSSIKHLQGSINAFLTQKMEEDTVAGGAGKADDAQEEENYGEELVEGD